MTQVLFLGWSNSFKPFRNKNPGRLLDNLFLEHSLRLTKYGSIKISTLNRYNSIALQHYKHIEGPK